MFVISAAISLISPILISRLRERELRVSTHAEVALE
jgi:hypothetical protein